MPISTSQKIDIKIFQDFLKDISSNEFSIEQNELAKITNTEKSIISSIKKIDIQTSTGRFNQAEKEALIVILARLREILGSELDISTKNKKAILYLKYFYNIEIKVSDIIEKIFLKIPHSNYEILKTKIDDLENDIFFEINEIELKRFFIELLFLVESKVRKIIPILSGFENTGKSVFITRYLIFFLKALNLIENTEQYLKIGDYMKKTTLVKLINDKKYENGVLQINECANGQIQQEIILNEVRTIIEKKDKTVIILTNNEKINKHYFKSIQNIDNEFTSLTLNVKNPDSFEIAKVFPKHFAKETNREITKYSNQILEEYFKIRCSKTVNSLIPIGYYKEMELLRNSLIKYKLNSDFPNEVVSSDIRQCEIYELTFKNLD